MVKPVIPTLQSDAPLLEDDNKKVVYAIRHLAMAEGLLSTAYGSATKTLTEIISESKTPSVVANKFEYQLQKVLSNLVTGINVEAIAVVDEESAKYSLKIDITSSISNGREPVRFKGVIDITKDGGILLNI